MNKMMTIAACTLVASAAFAEVLRDEDMQKAADNQQVQAALEADGVCLRKSDVDGSLQVIARDSVAYGIGTARDVRNKTEVAEMKAKRRLVAFIKSKLEAYRQHAASHSDTSTEASNGSIVTTLTTTHDAEMFQNAIQESTSGTLRGVVVLKTVKIPDEGSKTSGMIQVTVGYSAKTLAAATEAHNMITDSMNARRAIGDKPVKPNASECGKKADAMSNEGVNHNKPEVRRNDTIF